MAAVLTGRGINKRFGGSVALRDVDFHLDEGEILGLIGPNGAGKTTAIRILTTLTKPSSGQVLINGLDVARDPANVKSEFGIPT